MKREGRGDGVCVTILLIFNWSIQLGNWKPHFSLVNIMGYKGD